MAAYTYPGVYIQEIPSGNHSITGVATSIAAFVGWSNQGPVGQATMVESWPEYERTFGGMLPGNYLGYAVYQYFLNGGAQAYIIRLVDSTAVTAGNTIVGLELFAKNPGAWGNNIQVAVSNLNGAANTFNLQVLWTNGGQTQVVESYTNLSATSTDAKFAVRVINHDSAYLTFTAPGGTTPTSLTFPTGTTAGTSLNGGVAAANGANPATGNDGTVLATTDAAFATALAGTTTGYPLLAGVPIFNILTVPGHVSAGTIGGLMSFCQTHRAVLLVDAAPTSVVSDLTGGPVDAGSTALVSGSATTNAAFYFPWVQAPDPQAGSRVTTFPPSGFVAGIYAATDASRGVWKAPAGINAGLTGALGLQTVMTDKQNGDLNQVAVNCLRQFPTFGNVVWGSRTMAGADITGSDWKYVPIRRLALFLESSLYEGTQWAVFEPNAEPLWGQVRLSIGAFLQDLFLKGAFAGTSPQQAYFVKCDRENNPASTIAMGILNITVGFAPLYPAEFVVIQIQQMAGQV